MGGFALAILAGIFLGLFQSLHGKAEELPIRSATIILLLLASIFAVTLALVTEGAEAFLALSWSAVAAFVLGGAIHFSGGWLLIGLSQRSVGVGLTGLLVGATPVFTALVAWLVLGELLSLRDLAGIVLVVIGVGIATWP